MHLSKFQFALFVYNPRYKGLVFIFLRVYYSIFVGDGIEYGTLLMTSQNVLYVHLDVPL